MSAKLAAIQHTVLSGLAIIAITVLSYGGKCSQVEAVTVILAASGIGATGIMAHRGSAAPKPAPEEGGDG